jgi:hypothetical protein
MLANSYFGLRLFYFSKFIFNEFQYIIWSLLSFLYYPANLIIGLIRSRLYLADLSLIYVYPLSFVYNYGDICMKLSIQQLKTLVIFLGIFCLFMLSSCVGGGGAGAGGGAGPTPGLGSAKEITSYKANGITARINQENSAISFVLPYGTDITKVGVSLTTTGKSVTTEKVIHQVNRIGIVTLSHDFSTPEVYTVTAEDGTTTNYTATGTVAAKTDGSLSSYYLKRFPNNPGDIDEAAGTILLTLPYGTVLSKTEVANFTTTGGNITVAGTPQVSGDTENDFSDLINKPVIYTVTSAAGLAKIYKVVVQISSNTAKDITSFSIGNYKADISEESKTISLTLPFDTKLESQIATFATTGVSVTVGNPPVLQKTDETPNNFTSPVVYTVHAADGSTKDYTVTVKNALNSDKAITKFLFDGFSDPDNIGVINESAGTILVALPFNTNLNNLRADFTITGKSVTVNGVPQVSKVTENDFSKNGNTKTYTVHAADGSSKDYAVAVTSGVLKCWGNNDWGQLNVPKLIEPRTVSVGFDHICALDANGVKCWGNNEFGQNNVPASITGPIKSVYAGGGSTCVLDGNGLKCWGNNSWGQTNVPQLSNPIKNVSVSFDHICALDANGVKCWGNNQWGQTKVPQLSNPRMVSAGDNFTCVLDDSGVKCWGDNYYEIIDNIPKLTNPMSISAGQTASCALDANGVKCWGTNQFGQNDVPELINPISVAAGYNHACAIDANGLKCWGDNRLGQTDVPELINPVMVSAGKYNTCAISNK